MSRTVDVLVYSDQAHTAPVPLRAMSYEELWGGKGKSAGFTYSLDRTYAKVGEAVELTVTAPKDDAYDLLVMLAYTSDTSADYWPILVVNDDASMVGVDRPTITPEMLPKRLPSSAVLRRMLPLRR